MMNNTAHVLQFLDYVPTACHFDKVLENMSGYDGSSAADLTKSTNTLDDILTCAKEDMLNKLDKIILHVGNRVNKYLTITIKFDTVRPVIYPEYLHLRLDVFVSIWTNQSMSCQLNHLPSFTRAVFDGQNKNNVFWLRGCREKVYSLQFIYTK